MNITEPVDCFQLDNKLARDYKIYAGTLYDYTFEGNLKGKLRLIGKRSVSKGDPHG